MRIILGSDHGGYEMKEMLKKHLTKLKYPIDDKGCYSPEIVDYPEIATEVSQTVLESPKNIGILICGTGIGMSIMANKIKGIRAGLCHTELEARLAREHNHANILVLGGRILGAELVKSITEVFLKTPFSKDDRHKRRVCILNESGVEC